MNQTSEIDQAGMRDRRRDVRKIISVPVRYMTSGNGDHPGYVNDISNGGMFLLSNVRHEVGETIQADIDVEIYGKIVWAHGKIVHSNDRGIGVSFTSYDRIGIEELIDLAKVERMKHATELNIINAYGVESQANIRYLRFAMQAHKEKYPNVERLFKAIAHAEYVHAGDHFRELKHLNGIFVANSMAVFGLGDTKKNLSLAIIGETYEINEMYPVYIQVARFQEEKGALRSFEYSYLTEKEHLRLLEKAAAAVEKGTDVDLGQILVCDVCGYTIEGNPPDNCQVCNVAKDRFIIFK
jgi:rubrerythrin